MESQGIEVMRTRMKPAVCLFVFVLCSYQACTQKKKKKNFFCFIILASDLLWLLDGREGRRWSSFKDWRKEFQTNIAGSEELELNIAQILEKIERFIQLVAK